MSKIRKMSFPHRNKQPEQRPTINSMSSYESGPRPEPQVIEDDEMDAWALFLHLKNTFGVGNFKIEQRSDSYRVWAPRDINHQDIERCRI
jgi:hypothetical protein